MQAHAQESRASVGLMSLVALRFHDGTEDGRVAFVNPDAVVLIVPARIEVAGEAVDGAQIQFGTGWHFYVHGTPDLVAAELSCRRE
jgi:hypothetical protein